MVDEVYNFGVISIRKFLVEKYNYRFVLLVIFERYMDEEGIFELYNFFEKKVIRYLIKKVIEEKMLILYYYYFIVVYLIEIELGLYNELLKKIKKESRVDNEGKVILFELGKILILKRVRIVVGVFNKIEILKKNLEKYKEEKNILVYCGVINVLLEEVDFFNIDVSDVK